MTQKDMGMLHFYNTFKTGLITVLCLHTLHASSITPPDEDQDRKKGIPPTMQGFLGNIREAEAHATHFHEGFSEDDQGESQNEYAPRLNDSVDPTVKAMRVKRILDNIQMVMESQRRDEKRSDFNRSESSHSPLIKTRPNRSMTFSTETTGDDQSPLRQQALIHAAFQNYVNRIQDHLPASALTLQESISELFLTLGQISDARPQVPSYRLEEFDTATKRLESRLKIMEAMQSGLISLFNMSLNFPTPSVSQRLDAEEIFDKINRLNLELEKI